MAAKRKGGLKLNAICAKLSRQVVVEKAADAGPQAEGSPLRLRDREAGVARGARSEEDKRRAVIEKWVNGEYSEEPVPAPGLGRIVREGLELPPEGVYMVQPQGCSDEEDHGEEPPKDGSAVAEEKESDGAASKDDSGPATKQASGRCWPAGLVVGGAEGMTPWGAQRERGGSWGHGKNRGDLLGAERSFPGVRGLGAAVRTVGPGKRRMRTDCGAHTCIRGACGGW